MSEAPRPIPAAFLAEAKCDWAVLRNKSRAQPQISRCRWCEKMVSGGPVPCPVKQMREPADA